MPATRSAGLTAGILCAMGLATPGPSRAEPPVIWPQFHGQPDHQGVNPLEQTVGTGNVASLGLKWLGLGHSSQFGVVFMSSPAIAGGLAYFGDTGGNLYAFNANGCGQSTCAPVWYAPLVEGIYNSPAVADGVVYVGTASPQGALFAFNAAGCGSQVCTTPLWKSTPLSVVESSPTVVDGIVYVGSALGVYAFAAHGCGQPTCPPLWIGQTAGSVGNSPAVANGFVYAGGSDARLYVFAAGGCGTPTCTREVGGCGVPNCPPVWSGPVGAAILGSSPVVANGFVYVGSYWDGKLNVFDAGGCGAGECPPLWRGNAGTYVESSPAVADGRVFVGAGDAELKVFDAAGCGHASCDPLWVGFAPGPLATIESAPMVANGLVYVGENNKRVYAFPASGCGGFVCAPLWEHITDDPIVNSSPVMVNGTLYVTGSNFGITPTLYVFGLPGSVNEESGHGTDSSGTVVEP